MRIPTQAENETALAAIKAYEEFSNPHVQRNGWTVIPNAVARPVFQGEVLTTDSINAYTTTAELYRRATDKPDEFSAYVTDALDKSVRTWTGERLATITKEGKWTNGGAGSRFRVLQVRADWGGIYSGREYDSRQLVIFRRAR